MSFKQYVRPFSEGMRNVFRNGVMSLASVISMVCMLLMLGMVFAVVLNTNAFAHRFESELDVRAFLKEDLTADEGAAFSESVSGWEGVAEVTFISKQDALQSWEEELGDDGSLLEGYGEENNPLPASISLRVATPAYVPNIVAMLTDNEAVDTVTYSQDVVNWVQRISEWVRNGGMILIAILLIVTSIIISNTVRISVYARKGEINIMKYIGATNSYVRSPFVAEGFYLGLIGALLSYGAAVGAYAYLASRFDLVSGSARMLRLFQLVPLHDFAVFAAILFPVVGCGLGMLASFASTRRHLRV
jgi:cell division transport system permease protein